MNNLAGKFQFGARTGVAAIILGMLGGATFHQLITEGPHANALVAAVILSSGAAIAFIFPSSKDDS